MEDVMVVLAGKIVLFALIYLVIGFWVAKASLRSSKYWGTNRMRDFILFPVSATNNILGVEDRPAAKKLDSEGVAIYILTTMAILPFRVVWCSIFVVFLGFFGSIGLALYGVSIPLIWLLKKLFQSYLDIATKCEKCLEV